MNITEKIPEVTYENMNISQEQLQREFDYFRSQAVLKSMLNQGIISIKEFEKITSLNRETFRPALANIMPKLS